MNPQAPKSNADNSNKLKPRISLPVFDAISNAYAIARMEPVHSKKVIAFCLFIGIV